MRINRTKRDSVSIRTLRGTKSFTLIETLLAIAILSLAVIAPLSIASNGLAAATTGKDRLVAVALARDAVEYIRSVRDDNRLQGNFWLCGITGNSQAPCTVPGAGNADCSGASGCTVDSLAKNNNVQKRNSSNMGPLFYDPNTGLYGYTPGSLPNYSSPVPNAYSSKFTRWVNATVVSSDPTTGLPREERITATVQWQTIFATKSVVLVDQLTSW